MATDALRAGGTGSATTGRSPVRGGRYDNYFFTGMAILILISILVGFAKSYFLAGMFAAKLPTLVVHVHGAAFVSWIVLLVVQTSLVSAGRTDMHRKLGVAGFGLAALMVILGSVAATDMLRRGKEVLGIDPKVFFLGNVMDMGIFATLVFFAYRERMHPWVHKRLILIATIYLHGAAVVRWPFLSEQLAVRMGDYVMWSLLGALVLYDLWSERRLQRATILGGVFVVVAARLETPIAQTAPMMGFATWVMEPARAAFGR